MLESSNRPVLALRVRASIHLLLYVFLICTTLTVQVSRVNVKGVISNRSARVSRTPLTLHQGRGLHVYFVTYQPSSVQLSWASGTVNTVITTDSEVVIADFDPTSVYTFTVMLAQQGASCEAVLVQVSKC